MSNTSGLTVRQHKREEIELALEFVVCDEHAEQIRFSGGSSALDHRTLRGVTMDLSPGGMGIVCAQFVARMCEGHVRVYEPAAETALGAPIPEVAFEQRVKVRRVTLISHEPKYSLGVSFVDPDPDLKARIDDFLGRLAIGGDGDA